MDLTVLHSKAEEILKAEVAALLQNFGKVSSKFIAHYASDKPAGHDYDLKRVADPGTTINLILGQTEITSSQGVGLINALANTPIWGSLQPLSRSLGASVTGSSTAARATARRVRTSARTLVDSGASSSTDAGLIRNRLISALYLAELFQTSPVSAYAELDAKDKDAAQQKFLKQTRIQILTAEASFGELLLLMWDNLHGDPDDQQRDVVLEFWTGRNAALQRYLVTCHGIISSIEKETPAKIAQPLGETLVATAFGWEKQSNKINLLKLDASRDRWMKTVLKQTPNLATAIFPKARKRIVRRSEAVLRKALGETQRANNDVTLWDYVSTIATLYKAAVAKALLENRFVETSELKWRLLSIRYDGLEYLSRAHHVSDLLARRDALEVALDQVKAVIEVEYPLGNEIYRDESGSVLIVPHVQDGGNEIDLLKLPCGDENSLGQALANRFSGNLDEWREKRAKSNQSKEPPPLGGEIRPMIALSDEFLGKQIKLPLAKNWSHPQLQADPDEVAKWWEDKNQHGDVCTVCGLRPQGYGTRNPNRRKKAQSRQVCWVCLERREDRSQVWAENAAKDFQKTIWVSEVADNNGRVALVVGRFGLDGWLDGSLIPTMQKSDSFARIQRCWRTTEEFWKEVERDLPQSLGAAFRPRLIIKLKNSPDHLGLFHTYELEVAGAYLSAVWDSDKKHFITCENLDYFQQVAAIKGYDELKQRIAANAIKVYEPSAHLSRREKIAEFTVTADDLELLPVENLTEKTKRSSPFIPILAKPALFMALVPADKALNVVGEIKKKYETEMGKVRDRLPIHLGVVFAPHRTPMRAMLEAGRKMLEIPEEVWELREVVEADDWDDLNLPVNGKRRIRFTNGVEWEMPLLMGDEKTVDQWYPHLFSENPTVWLKQQKLPEAERKKLPESERLAMPALVRATVLKGQKLDSITKKIIENGSKVWVRPSRFDFEFLDVSARRNEISYTRNCRRRGSTTRPFLLEDLDKLNRMWNSLGNLTTSHLHHLEATLTSYITDWFNGDLDNAKPDDLEVFKEFAATTLRRLDGGWWKREKGEQDLLTEAVGNGQILDLLELRMHILKEKPEKQSKQKAKQQPQQQEDEI